MGRDLVVGTIAEVGQGHPAEVILEGDVQLAAEAVAEQAESRGGAIWSQREARGVPAGPTLADDLAAGRLVLAGTIDDVVVGYAVVRTEPLRDGTLLGVVTDVYVEPDARARGGVPVGQRRPAAGATDPNQAPRVVVAPR